MFKFSGFTGKANAAVNAAIAQACILGHTYVGSEHLLLGLLEAESGIAGNILHGRGVEWGKIRQKLIETVGRGIKTQMSTENFTPRVRKNFGKFFDRSPHAGAKYCWNRAYFIISSERT